MGDGSIKSFSKIKLLCVRIVAWCVLFFERIWLRLLPFVLVLSLLCSLSWFGIFNLLNYWSHLLLLALVFFAAVWSLFPLFGFRLPTIKDIDRRIERASGHKHQPLSVQRDHLCSEDDEGFRAIVWREHQRRMSEQLHHLQVGFVYPNSASYDPMAIRALFILLFVCAFSFSFSPSGGRLTDAFDLHPMVDEVSMRIDAWITPPAYTGVAPIYLTRGEITQFAIPENSDVVVRVVNDAGVTVKAISEEDGHKVLLAEKHEKTSLNDPVVHFETRLERSINLSVSSRHKQYKWHLQMMKDQSPTICWLEKPGRILAGSLELQYEMDDDYGVTKAFVEIEPLFNQSKDAVPLYKAPEIELLLAHNGKGKMRMVQDLSSHPWAGAEVKITLVAEDGAGQQGRSKTFVMTLPQRIFTNPVARAVSEQRRLLALDAGARERVLDMLSALLARPERGLKNATHFLVLQSAWTRLSMAETEDQVRDVVHYLWQIALGIEGDQFESAQKRLKQAQVALRDALRHGASDTEIERLMADLRQAMDDYIRALAENAPENSNSGDTDLSADTLYKKLDSIEEMAKIGSSSAAEQLLAEMEQTLDHLQVRKSNSAEEQNNSQTDRMKEKMDQLGDLMRRQQEILNDTHRLETEQRHGEMMLKDLRSWRKALKNRQAELQSELLALERELSEQGIEQSDALKEAEEKMNSAKNDLDHGNHEMSLQNQSRALESLRQGAQSVLKTMREALQKAGNNPNITPGPQDPLGRPLSSETEQDKGKTPVLQDSDRTRARQILEEIRKRLGKEHIPEVEKNYLERLLRFN
ncbi:TIGR02302 family protein [Bartonella sp. A05]|uniref:TIGR02302 family protein n=1 Tax=Bartonella sp. A05 TaxID=2967261 RepID=UPI0022A9BD73|nr:TIGR02302 family protein [Bartonella sp. A05]MCZ2203562.1 TIGR02302 family protein [Bartonella sp. A05]